MKQNTTTDALAQRVIERLHQTYKGAPFFSPRQIAPLLGITDNAFTVYCRRSRHLRLWRGSYRFYTDDPEHIEILKKVIAVVLWSGIKIPPEFRPHGRAPVQ